VPTPSSALRVCDTKIKITFHGSAGSVSLWVPHGDGLSIHRDLGTLT